MENNNNLTQENRAFKKEDAYETLGIINTWIGNMDTKVSFALALAGGSNRCYIRKGPAPCVS